MIHSFVASLLIALIAKRAIGLRVSGQAEVRIEILAADREAEPIIATICEAARTGTIGDGKVRSRPVEDVVRIRTGERGVGAIRAAAPGRCRGASQRSSAPFRVGAPAAPSGRTNRPRTAPMRASQRAVSLSLRTTS